jgi:hypothetical protein
MAISVPISARMMINSKKFCFAKFLDQSSFERIVNPDALCGNRDPLLQRTAPGRRKIVFTTFHDVTIPILEELLVAAGMTESTGTYTANQLVAEIPIIIDKAGAVHEYPVCRMTRFILRGQTGTLPVSAECTWIADDELEDAATSWVDGDVDYLFGFPGTTFKIATVAADIDRFAFVIDNKLVQSWNASYTVTDVGMGPRQTLLATTIPYTTANKDYYWNYRGVTTGVAIELKIISGVDSLTINIPKAVLNPESPSIEGALEEIRLPMTWEAKRQTSTEAFNMVMVDG